MTVGEITTEMETVENGFARLAAAGFSIIVASGDSGSALRVETNHGGTGVARSGRAGRARGGELTRDLRDRSEY